MPVTFNVPKQTSKSVYNVDEFKGVDLTNSPTNVDDNKSPNAINMIRDVPNKVRKRMGFEVLEDYVDPDSYLKNFCEISFNNISVREIEHIQYFNRQVGKYSERDLTTDYLDISYNLEDKTITLNGTLNDHYDNYVRYDSQTHTSIYERYPSAGKIHSYDLFNFDVTAGSYKVTLIPLGGDISQQSDLYNGRSQGVTGDSLQVIVKADGVSANTFSLAYNNYSDKTTQDTTINTAKTLTFSLYFPNEREVRFNNFKIGLNYIKDIWYEEGQDYIPADSDIPTDLRVNGCHFRREDTHPLYHIGTNLVQNGVVKYTEMANNISHSWQFDDKLFIMDGKKFLIYDGNTVAPVENDAYIPTVSINRDPIWARGGGGGVEYEAFNLLQPKWTETFVVTESTKTSTQFPLTFGDLDNTPVQAWIMDANGEWVEKYQGTDFSVDRTNGVITFNTAPGLSPLNGEDSVKITASRADYFQEQGYPDRINKCTFGTRFGVNGAFDRLFVSGNPDFPNGDWYSEQWDLTYFPDSSYALLGSSKSAVVGYSIVSNYLAAHKDELEEDLSIIVREGDLITDKDGIDRPSFRIINTLQGAGAIANNSFSYLCTEPLFLTRSGLYAVTAQDITGEKYAQSRSFYLNGKLTKEKFEDLQKSFAVIFNDMYILCVNERVNPEVPSDYTCKSRLYILDGLQPMRTDKSEPYSTRQYAAFYCEMENINCMWERENRLYFGTVTGKICRFYNDKDSIYSYNDGGQPIYCQWETPDIDGQLFYKNKTLRYIALRAGAAIATSVEIWGMDRGIWKFIKKDTAFGNYLSFPDIQFSKFSFSCNREQRISRTKVRIKKVDKYRLRFINQELNEPFSLYDLANEYVESGNYKG